MRDWRSSTNGTVKKFAPGFCLCWRRCPWRLVINFGGFDFSARFGNCWIGKVGRTDQSSIERGCNERLWSKENDG